MSAKTAVEGAELAAFGHRNGDAALRHEGEQAQGLQGHGLAAGVGPGDDQQAVLRGERQVDGHHFRRPGVLPVALNQQGVAGLA